MAASEGGGVGERPDPAKRDGETRHLIVRCQVGDPSAFAELYRRYFDSVYTYARTSLHDPHEAQDVAQAVFAKLIEALPRFEFRSEPSFRVWLLRITRNAILDLKRSSGRLSVEEPAWIERRLRGTGEDLSSALGWIKDKDLDFLIERLPNGQRDVVVLRYRLGLDTEEIASALGRSPRAVHDLHRRALRTLEQRLTALGHRRLRSRRIPTEVRMRPAPVLGARRFALRPSWWRRPPVSAAALPGSYPR